MKEQKKTVIQTVDDDTRRLAKTLLRNARFAALAFHETGSLTPMISRIGLATDLDGSPITLISGLSAHTQALQADPRCALLVGEPGKGDVLAYPRLSLICRAQQIKRDETKHERIARRYLNHNPKAKLYASLGDFAFFHIEVERASMNGGFGKAYQLAANDIITDNCVNAALADSEQSAIDHMNEEHRDAIALYARHFGKAKDGDWTISGFDSEGMDLVCSDQNLRVFFPEPLVSAQDLRRTLVEMAKAGRM
ncbi:HugZ family protein [Aquamicrobium segne]|uniref:HugZ family protein n=1 Tax=Aquamicrobium segne TaxID=469547 RepID=A0ABW0GXD4_9HYPH